MVWRMLHPRALAAALPVSRINQQRLTGEVFTSSGATAGRCKAQSKRGQGHGTSLASCNRAM